MGPIRNDVAGRTFRGKFRRYLARAGRGLVVGEPRGETRCDRDRREKGTHNNGGHGYEIGREGRLPVTPQLSSSELHPATGVD